MIKVLFPLKIWDVFPHSHAKASGDVIICNICAAVVQNETQILTQAGNYKHLNKG